MYITISLNMCTTWTKHKTSFKYLTCFPQIGLQSWTNFFGTLAFISVQCTFFRLQMPPHSMLGINWSTFSPAHYSPPPATLNGGEGLQKKPEYVIKSDLKDKTLYCANEFVHDCSFMYVWVNFLSIIRSLKIISKFTRCCIYLEISCIFPHEVIYVNMK